MSSSRHIMPFGPGPVAARPRARHVALLATSIIALSPAVAAQPEEVLIGQPLTAGADLLTLGLASYTIDRSPDVFGLAPPQRITGVAALGGNDDVLLAGIGNVEGTLTQTRIYANLPVDLPTLTLFTESPLTRITLTGADGGEGNDALRLGGALTVAATGNFNLGKLDMDVSVPTTLTPDSLNADLDVIARGLADTVGNNSLSVDGRLDSNADAIGTRSELNISLADLSNQPQLLTSTAAAIGLLSGAGADALAIGIAGEVNVAANSQAISTDLTIAGLVVGSPESAAVANSIARVMDAGAGNDVLLNAGSAGASAKARLIETGISVVAAGYTLPEILVPDVSPESGANARALGLIGGLGADRITNSGALSLAADSTLIRTSIAFTDAGIDSTAIEMLFDLPTFPDEPGRGAVARVAGILGDDNPLVEVAGTNHDSIINSGSITGDAIASMTTTAAQIAVPINEVTGVSDTTAGKLMDAISIGLTDDASAAAAAFAQGILGGSGLDSIIHGGAIALTADAEADTGQFKLDIASFLEPSEEQGAGESSETSFSLSLDVFNTGAFAIAEATGIDGGSGSDRISTLAGSTLTAASDARSRMLDADITVSNDDKAFNLGGSVVFSLSLAGATTIGITGGSGIDVIDSAGSIDVAADALVQALKANVKVSAIKQGFTLNAQMVDADMQSTAAATGILAGDLADQVSAGSIKARANSDVESIAVAVNVSVATEKGLAGTGSFLTTDYRSEATAIGVDRFTLDPTNFPRPLPSGIVLGRSILRDGAVFDIDATADFQRVGVAANVGAAKKGAAIAASIFELEAVGTASAYGLRGSLFEDVVISGASITSNADVTGLTSETSLAVAGGETGFAAGVGLVLGDSTATALARGIDLGGGTNSLLSTGSIMALADVANTANGNSVTVEGAKQGVAIGAAVVKIDTAAVADALAISSEGGNDVIDVRGALAAGATSDADIITVTLSVSGAMDGVAAGAGVILADGSATARAGGVGSGGGNDRVTLGANVLTYAQATLDSVGVGLTVAGAKNGVGAGASVLSTRFGSDATGFAVQLGSGNDQLLASAPMMGIGVAASDVKSVAINVTGALNGVGIGAGVVLADVTATGSARTVDLGEGDDVATIAAGLNALATATAANTGAGVSVSGANNGVGAGAAAVVNTTLASAHAAALAAGDGADTVVLRAATASAGATTTALNIAASVSGANNGVGAGAGVILSDAGSRATATTVDLGAGADRATLDELVAATGTASTSSTGVGVNIAGVNNGVALGASLISATVGAEANGTALAAGSEADRIDGRGRLSGTATANAHNTTVSLDVGGAVNGVAAGAAVALADTSATASSNGAALGIGNDVLILGGGAESNATANARSTSVGVKLSGTYQGVAAGVALVDSSTEATAAALAADGGEGDDTIDLGGVLSSAATATARNLSVSVGISFSVFGVGAGGAGVLGTVASLANAAGLVGGAGNDTLIARDTVSITASSTGEQTSVAVGLGLAIGVALAATYVDSGLSATATATGLAGDAGNDILVSAGILDVRSTATATGATYSISGNLGVGGGANILTSGTSSVATATGQSGGDGNDSLSAKSDVAATSSATSIGSSLSVTLTGANLGDMSNAATATAIGLDGGSGNDVIAATGIVTSSATASAEASNIGIGFTGATIADISNSGNAVATAIFGGEGNDTIVSDKGTSASAGASSDIETVNVQLTGAGQAMLGSSTIATATGIDGGGGDDVIRALDSSATASSILSGDSYGVTAVGLAGQTSTLAATAQAVGVSGGNGRNNVQLTNTGVLAGASAMPTSLNLSLAGFNAATLGNQANAIGTAYRGGSERDEVQLNGTTLAYATARATNDRIGISLIGADTQTTQLSANADSAIARSGNGGDLVVTSGTQLLDAAAVASSNGTTVAIFGGIDSSLGARAIGRGTGLAGGTGADVLVLGGSLTGNAAATVQSNADTVSVIGAGIGRNRNIADAAIAAIDGGSGNDQLEIIGGATLTAASTVRNEQLDFNVAGAIAAYGGLDSLARASGIDTGVGDASTSSNSATVAGALRLTATAGISNVGTGISLLGAALGNVTTTIRATTTGLIGNAGRDTLTNSGMLTLAATAGGGSQRTSITLIGIKNITAATSVFATATGLSGGDSNDTLRNSGVFIGNATATARSSSLSASGVAASLSNADNLVDARIAGMDGGAGIDSIRMDGTMILNSLATSTGADWSATLVGGSLNSARTLASAGVFGILGGGGADAIVHSGNSTLGATSQISSTARSIVLAGVASGEAGLFAIADGVGIDGGGDDDQISIALGSRLTLDAAASLNSVASNLSLLGLASSGGVGGATSTALGVAGGSGNDAIAVAGVIDVGAAANLNIQASNFTLFGAVNQAGRFRAAATATGIEAGTGNDGIAYSGTGNVSAVANAFYLASGMSAVGTASTDAAIGATARALGLGGGSGSNNITLASVDPAPFAVLARADSNLASQSSVVLGGAINNGAASSESVATGIAGDIGNDSVMVGSALGVTGRAGMTFDQASFAFAGAASGGTSALVRSIGTAIDLNAGNNSVTLNDKADINVDVLVDARGSAAAGAALGSANAAAVTRGEANAHGIRSGNGTDSFDLAGKMTITAGATIHPNVLVNSGALFADGIARATSFGTLNGLLLSDAGGATSVMVRSGAVFRVEVGVPPGNGINGITRAEATSNGVSVGIDVDARAFASANGRTTATGIGLGTGTGNIVTNNGSLLILGRGEVDGRATANGNSAVSGDATANASSTLNDSVGRGVASAAALTLNNSKLISVEMRPVALAMANAGANGLGVTDPDATSTATANASNTIATGVEMGGGNLINSGEIRAVSAPRAEAVAGARPSGSFNTSIDSVATATANAVNTQAYGIRSNTRAVVIENSGTIFASALPEAIARAGAFGNGLDGDATATTFAQTLNTLASGIDLFAAGSSITNSGTILAIAQPDNVSLPEAQRGRDGSQVATPFIITSSVSYGIRATGGNNSIVNTGTITGTVAIQTGSGIDTVSLLGGRTNGTINLGAGNDSITIANTPVVNGQLIGGDGVDSITVNGAVTLGGGISGFERLLKTGAGQANFGFIAWEPTEFSRIEAGRVFVQGGLSQTSHKLTTLIYSNGSLGALASGSPAPFVPRGALIVELGDAGVFVNNTTWDVIESASVMNVTGLAVALPQATALRSFSGALAAGSTRYRVRVAVQAMSSIATPGIAASYGAALDQLTPVATGAVAGNIAELQAIPTAEALRTRLGNDAPTLPTRSLATAGAMLDSALAVTAAAPSLIGRPAVAPGLTLVGSAADVGTPGRWSAAFNDLPSGNAGIGQGNGIGYASGFTALAGDTVEVGMGMMWTARDAQFTTGTGRSEATIVTGRLLMAPAPDLRIAANVAAGRTRFDGSRTLANGGQGVNRQTGGMLALDSQVAWSPAAGGLNPSLSAAISYRRVDGDGMREGSAGLALLVDRSHWQRAETRIGLSLAPELALGGWRFVPRLGAHWLHRLGGAQDGVEARFAAMPDHSFVLSNGSLARNSVALDGGFSLTSGRWSLNAAATSRADIGGRWTEGRMSLGLSF